MSVISEYQILTVVREKTPSCVIKGNILALINSPKCSSGETSNVTSLGWCQSANIETQVILRVTTVCNVRPAARKNGKEGCLEKMIFFKWQ